MTTATFSTTTFPIQSAATSGQTSGQVQIKAAILPNGNIVPAHAFVDASGDLLDPAKDATVQTATAAILATATSLLTTN